MRYRFLLNSDNGADQYGFAEVITVESDLPDPALEARLVAEVQQTINRVLNEGPGEGAPHRVIAGILRGRPARGIYILATPEPDACPAGVKQGEVIPSSMDLSLLLGYKFNMVTQAFATAKKKRNERAAKAKSQTERERIMNERIEVSLRNVVFCYADELGTV